jgi:hypothetical protein
MPARDLRPRDESLRAGCRPSGRGARPPSAAWLGLVSIALLALGPLGGCKASVVSSKTEDEARLMIPVPICVKRLPRATTPGAIVSLSSEEYWSLLLPSYDRNQKTINPAAPDCSGRLSLASLSPPGYTSLRVDPEKTVVSPGADALKIVWLESHKLGEGTTAGLIALTRQRESYLEVYAVGLHRGHPEGTRFTLQRMGPRIVVEAVQEDCLGEGSERRCHATNAVYLMGTGALQPAATFPIDQAAKTTSRDGSTLAEYHFSASADYKDTSIELTEHLSVSAKGQGEVRSSDLERAFRLENGKLVASGESLWTKTLRELGQKTNE